MQTDHTQKVAIINSTKEHTHKTNAKTDRVRFSRLLRYPARKQLVASSGSILITAEPAWGQEKNKNYRSNSKTNNTACYHSVQFTVNISVHG